MAYEVEILVVHNADFDVQGDGASCNGHVWRYLLSAVYVHAAHISQKYASGDDGECGEWFECEEQFFLGECEPPVVVDHMRVQSLQD